MRLQWGDGNGLGVPGAGAESGRSGGGSATGSAALVGRSVRASAMRAWVGSVGSVGSRHNPLELLVLGLTNFHFPRYWSRFPTPLTRQSEIRAGA